MDKNKLIKNPQKLLRYIGLGVSLLLIVFEVIIAVRFLEVSPNPEPWKIAALISCAVALDVLCLVELYAIKTFTARIVVYSFDFVILVFISAITGSAYLVALYCVILTQMYLNVEDLKSRTIAFAVSCALFVVTVVVGWFLMHLQTATWSQILSIISDCVTGIIILIVHFSATNFLVGFYRTNIKLTKALQEADESKRRLEEAYAKLSETAALEERNRIARDIHDNAGHSMTAVIMQTEAAKLLIDSDPEQAKAKVISANIQAKNALEQMRDSVHLLAGRYNAKTLKEELEEIIAQTMDGTDVKIRFDVDEAELKGDRRRFITNSLKEFLSNGIRHGGATAFYVRFSVEGGRAELTVSDNGRGLPPSFKEGFGLKGISEKALSFGGNIVYESESGDGLEITISIKTGEEEEDND